jgi:hypothetical protein
MTRTETSMAWSDAARRAAILARRLKRVMEFKPTKSGQYERQVFMTAKLRRRGLDQLRRDFPRERDLSEAREKAYSLAKGGSGKYQQLAAALSPHHNPLVATRMGMRSGRRRFRKVGL